MDDDVKQIYEAVQTRKTTGIEEEITHLQRKIDNLESEDNFLKSEKRKDFTHKVWHPYFCHEDYVKGSELDSKIYDCEKKITELETKLKVTTDEYVKYCERKR